QDAVGNTSAASNVLNVTTSAVGGNKLTVYYQAPNTWTNVNLHYGINGGSWTAVPGVPMNAACAGWKMEVINLGAATGAQLAFNNGAGQWDSKNGANYQAGIGVAAVQNGTLSSSNPCTSADTTAPTIPSALQATNVTATSASLSWTASTDASGSVGYQIWRNGVLIGTTAAVNFVDTALVAGNTYRYSVRAYDGASNISADSTILTVNTPTASNCAVTFTISNANTTVGQNLYVVGNQTALGNWTPASSFALSIQGSGANVPWTGTINLPSASTISYKFVKWNGTSAVWESNQATASGNRELTTPATCATAIIRNDGSFKF
ncbi:MAG: alpha-amylase, partial [Burkholderiales bacterium]|nr:alpha-amylase [Burkholderiales bacterium]